MVWWLFKKGNLHKKVEHINNSLQNSFRNVQQDMTKLNNWINQSYDHHSKKILDIEERLNRIERFFSEEETEESQEEQEISIGIKNIDPLINLTSTQKNLFLTIYEMEKQLGQAISTRSLAEILYKGKEYDKVRAMLSRFISELAVLNLINKEKTGKKIFVSTTPNGAKIAKAKIKKDNKRKK